MEMPIPIRGAGRAGAVTLCIEDEKEEFDEESVDEEEVERFAVPSRVPECRLEEFARQYWGGNAYDVVYEAVVFLGAGVTKEEVMYLAMRAAVDADWAYDAVQFYIEYGIFLLGADGAMAVCEQSLSLDSSVT